MDKDLIAFIKTSRKNGMPDGEIVTKLAGNGWDPETVSKALQLDLNLPVPPPSAAVSVPAPPSMHSPVTGAAPVSVVTNFSTRGLEYIIMFIAMGITALAVGTLTHNLANQILSGSGDSYSDVIVNLASAALVVALPVYTILFLRLKKAEHEAPALLADPSRRLAVQLTMIVTFLIGIYRVIIYIYSILSSTTTVGAHNVPVLLNLTHALITFTIAGIIFGYYWSEERGRKKGIPGK